MALFTFVALKATQGETPFKYLGVINDGSQNQGYLAYTVDEVLNPNTKFELEYAHDGLVHIRSCITNKYWVRSSEEGKWIMAKAREKQDDKAVWNCTLFRMDVIGDDNKATFYHVQSESTVRIPNDGSDRNMFLSIDPAANSEAVSIAIDFESLVVLPKLVAFKGDNGLFFNGAIFYIDDIGDKWIAWDINNTRDGQIYVTRTDEDVQGVQWMWYRSSSDGMIGALTDVILTPDALFSVVKVDDDVIALKCMGNNKFCIRDQSNKMFANASSITKGAQLEVVEPVFRREVNVLEYNLDNARVYNLEPVMSAKQTSDNNTNEEQEATLNLGFSTTKTTTWNNSVGLKLGVKTTFKSGIPRIAEAGIEVSAETSFEHQFGGQVEESQEVGGSYTVKVPPMKRVVARGVATKGTCDIPYSYVQVDHLANGKTIRTPMGDGVFTGVNAYDFYNDVHYEDLPDELIPRSKI